MKQSAALILPFPRDRRPSPDARAGGRSLADRAAALARESGAAFVHACDGGLAAAAAGLDPGITDVLLLRADAPLLTAPTLRALVARRREARAPAAYLARGNEPLAAALARDVAAAGGADLSEILAALPGERLVRGSVEDAEELLLVTSNAELARADGVLRRRAAEAAMAAGVVLVRPETITLDETVVLEEGCVVEPFATLTGETRAGRDSRIGQGCVIADTVLGARVTVKPYSVIERSRVGDGAIVGPFARLREGTELAEDVHVGNFVETKKARLARGVKANHLTYLGDTTIGERTNVGAGVITCNYDGFAKHETRIGADVFVGSDTQLVAPVSVGDGAVIGAGTTVTRDVPANALAIARAPQENAEGQAAVYREKKRAASRKKEG